MKHNLLNLIAYCGALALCPCSYAAELAPASMERSVVNFHQASGTPLTVEKVKELSPKSQQLPQPSQQLTPQPNLTPELPLAQPVKLIPEKLETTTLTQTTQLIKKDESAKLESSKEKPEASKQNKLTPILYRKMVKASCANILSEIPDEYLTQLPKKHEGKPQEASLLSSLLSSYMFSSSNGAYVRKKARTNSLMTSLPTDEERTNYFGAALQESLILMYNDTSKKVLVKLQEELAYANHYKVSLRSEIVDALEQETCDTMIRSMITLRLLADTATVRPNSDDRKSPETTGKQAQKPAIQPAQQPQL